MDKSLSKNTPITYSSSGVKYEKLDLFKKFAQFKAKTTTSNFEHFRISKTEESRGESAYVWEEENTYRAFVTEGLGTKNLVADEVRKYTKETFYDAIAQDTVAMIVNDLIVVGAEPQVVNAYFAVGDSNWFTDEKRSGDLAEGWTKACNTAGAVWGGGETPTLKGIIDPNTIDLAGSAIGIIKPKKRLILGDKLSAGDRIFLIESSGVHANGFTLARKIAEELPKGYAAKLSDGKSYGESLLVPTHIYVPLIRGLFEAGIDIHYMVNITGHGWRKLMRANKDFSYVIDKVPEPPLIFKFIQEHSRNDDREMYGNFNMGAGFAVFMPEKYIKLASRLAEKNKLNSWNAGYVEKGPKQVIIKPKEIIFKSETLKIR